MANNKDKTLVYLNGKVYKQIGPNDVIKKGALHSMSHGNYFPLMWESTVGKTPADISNISERLFFNPLTNAEKKELKKGSIS